MKTFQYPRVSLGDQLLVEEPEESGFKNAALHADIWYTSGYLSL